MTLPLTYSTFRIALHSKSVGMPLGELGNSALIDVTYVGEVKYWTSRRPGQPYFSNPESHYRPRTSILWRDGHPAD